MRPLLLPTTLLLLGFSLIGCPGNNDSPKPSTDASSDSAKDARQDTQSDTSQDTKSDTQGVACVDTAVYVDGDGDGYGQGAATTACLKPDEAPAQGFARLQGDCADNDPLAYEGSEGVCGDLVDDSCDEADEACPTSQVAQMNVPQWDCTGTPPDNVYAWARFDDGEGYFEAGGCFVFFQGSAQGYYVQRRNITRVNKNPSCDQLNGCVCPSLNNRPSYDRRLYALTKSDTVDPCEELALDDRIKGDTGDAKQPVSNTCRKYLYQLHAYEIPYSFVASTLEHLKARLGAFPTVEIACLEDSPHQWLPWASLLSFPIEVNAAFKPL